MEGYQVILAGLSALALAGPVVAVGHRVVAGRRPGLSSVRGRLVLMSATVASAAGVGALMNWLLWLLSNLACCEGNQQVTPVVSWSSVIPAGPAVVVVVAAVWAARRGRVRSARWLAAVPVLSASMVVAALYLVVSAQW